MELVSRTEILERKDKLNKIKLDLNKIGGESSSYRYYFRDSEVRELIEKLGFDNEDKYFFFSTAANPEADEIVRKNYKKFKVQTCTSWHFSPDIMDFLIRLIHEKNEHHVSFSQVRSKVHNLDGISEEIYWPTVHILKNLTKTRKREFVDSVENVLVDNFEKIKEREAPQNYNLETYKLWRRNKIKPIILREGCIFAGEEIKKAMDWLFQYSYEMEYIEHYYDDY